MDQLTSSTVPTLISHLEARWGKHQERFGITHTKQVSQNSSFFGVQMQLQVAAAVFLQSMIFRYFMTFWLWYFKLEVGCFLLRGSEGIASRFSPAERSHYYMLQKYAATGRVLIDKRRWMIPFLVVVRQPDYTPHPKDLGLDSPARRHFIRNVHALRHNYFMLNTQMVEVEWIPFSCVSAPIVLNTLKRNDYSMCCHSLDFHKDIALLCPNVPNVPKALNGHNIPWFQDVCDLIGHRQKAPSRSRLCQHGTWDKKEKGFVGIWMWTILAWAQGV